jgi:hypothetical protein
VFFSSKGKEISDQSSFAISGVVYSANLVSHILNLAEFTPVGLSDGLKILRLNDLHLQLPLKAAHDVSRLYMVLLLFMYL